MVYRRKITDIIEKLVSQIDLCVTIFVITENIAPTLETPGTWLLEVDDIKWAQIGFCVTINGEKYKILDFDDCKMILTVSGNTPIDAACFDMYKIQFFYGTPKGENAEQIALINKDGIDSVFPFIWLWNTPEKVIENFTLDPEDAIERESTMSLFFLTTSVSDDKRPPALVENYVGPMDRMKQNFIKAVIYPFSGIYKWGQNEKSKSYQSLGITLKQKEGGKALFAGEMAGIEMNITLNVYKEDT